MSKTKVPTSGGKIAELADEWERSLSARNLSDRTTIIYLGALAHLNSFLLAEGLSTDLADITRDHMRAYLDRRLGQVKASTTSVAYRALSAFLKWCVAEDVIDRSPLDNVPGPMVIVPLVPVLSAEQLRALFAACAGRGFTEVRDLAILRLFVDSGMRRGEMAGLKLEDVDMDQGVAFVVGKGRRPRAAPFGDHTATALSRYRRLRGHHAHKALSWFWIGAKGRVTDSGLSQILTRRSRMAGVGHINPHQFRHTFAAAWLSEGGSEGDLMQLLGWKS
jgi:site-specific recombinase XerD